MHFRATSSRLIALLALGVLPGCWLPFGRVDVTRPDPLRGKAVTIAGLSGRTVVLAGGRKVELAGLELPSAGVDPHHARDVRAELASTLLGGGYHVIVAPEPDGRGRLIGIRMHDKPIFEGPICPLAQLMVPPENYRSPDVPVGILIPIFCLS